MLLSEDTSADQVADAAFALIEDTLGEGPIADLLGSFFDGVANSGMERRGSRDDYNRR